jgi:hypothetical protein
MLVSMSLRWFVRVTVQQDNLSCNDLSCPELSSKIPGTVPWKRLLFYGEEASSSSVQLVNGCLSDLADTIAMPSWWPCNGS